MTIENYYKDIKHVIYVSTNSYANGNDFANAINQYIKEHDYKVLHIGIETSTDKDIGDLRHNSVAILGK